MKLLFAHQNLGAFAGAEANILITATELRRRGHTLGLLYNQPTGRGESQWQSVFSSVFCAPAARSREHVEAALAEFNPDLVYLHSLPDLDGCQALLDSQRPVVRMVHDHSLYCLRSYKYNYFTRKVCNRPASGFCVFPCLASVARNRGGRIPVRWASLTDKLNEIRVHQHCQALVVYSDYCRQELVRNGFEPRKIHLHVPIPCWGEDGPVSSFSERNLILFAGQLIRGKGVDVLLRSLAKVRAPFECLILGEGSHRYYCERLSRRLGLADRVRFGGYVAPEQLKDAYLQASLFVMSSVWPEPFGMSGPEAMRYGLPVVAFDAGGIHEWLTDGENGRLIPWMDVDAYAAAVQDLLLNKTRARQLGMNGLRRVNRDYDATRQVSRLEALFSNLCQGRELNCNESGSLTLVHGNYGQ